MLKVAIDFGTTYYCCAVLKEEVELIEDAHGRRKIPSIVAYTEEEQLVGHEALSSLKTNPENSVFGIKKIIGRTQDDLQKLINNRPFTIQQRDEKFEVQVEFKGVKRFLSPEELAGIILSRIREDASHYQHSEVKGAVIAVPPNFDDAQRCSILDAARVAGFEETQLIDETTAAALSLIDTKQTKHTTSPFMIFDFGGGYLSVSILQFEKKHLSVKASSGADVGGDDINDQILEHFKEKAKRKFGNDITKAQINRLRAECEKVKRDLCAKSRSMRANPSCKISIDDFNGRGDNFTGDISREMFETANESIFSKVRETVMEVVKAAGLKTDQIDEVVLMGGSSRVPRIQRGLESIFEQGKIKKTLNRDEAIAAGAALFLKFQLKHQRREASTVSSIVEYRELRTKVVLNGRTETIVLPMKYSLFSEGPFQVIAMTLQAKIDQHGIARLYEQNYTGETQLMDQTEENQKKILQMVENINKLSEEDKLWRKHVEKMNDLEALVYKIFDSLTSKAERDPERVNILCWIEKNKKNMKASESTYFQKLEKKLQNQLLKPIKVPVVMKDGQSQEWQRQWSKNLGLQPLPGKPDQITRPDRTGRNRRSNFDRMPTGRPRSRSNSRHFMEWESTKETKATSQYSGDRSQMRRRSSSEQRSSSTNTEDRRYKDDSPGGGGTPSRPERSGRPRSRFNSRNFAQGESTEETKVTSQNRRERSSMPRRASSEQRGTPSLRVTQPHRRCDVSDRTGKDDRPPGSAAPLRQGRSEASTRERHTSGFSCFRECFSCL